jgi:putative ABC transport system ATP-binding protein
MIDIQNLHVTFGAHTPLENKALRGLSVQVKEGQFVTVIGSNGAGKSTLLNVLSGEVQVSKGTITINGIDVTNKDTHQRSALVSRVFQNPLAGTCESLTIEENLALALKRGHPRRLFPANNSRSRQIFRDKVKYFGLGLEDRLGDKMGLLSGGQRQAVSLLMATLTPSKILLLDEHTAALDPKTANFVLDLTKKIVTEQKLTTIMVTHSMKQALNFGERTLMLHNGQIAFDVREPERQFLEVKDLLALFEKNQGETLTDDALLLSN